MPYRVDLRDPPAHAFETLVDLGALDVDAVEGGLAAIMPDAVPATVIARALELRDMRVSVAVGRDDDSVWMLSPRPVRVGTFVIVPKDAVAPPDALRMTDSGAFGTGLHATTALCLEALEDRFDAGVPARVLDVGTGSGILALAALRLGAERAVGLDLDAGALRAAAANACLNHLEDRLALVRGGPDAVAGAWPLVLANIRAAELMAMAPGLVQRIASQGYLVLSGIPCSVASEVDQTYHRLGMTQVTSYARGTWAAIVLRASW